MPIKDTVLSIDLTEKDCLYRILREDQDSSQKRVVYVHLKHLDIIPEDSRTYGPLVIRAFSKLSEWMNGWKTLIISQCESGGCVEQDTFEPHTLLPQRILGSYPYFNLFDLPIAYSMKTRVHCIIRDGWNIS